MQPLAAAEPADVELLCTQARSDPPVGEHRPGSVRGDERDDDAVCAFLDGPVQLDSALDELVRAANSAATSEPRLPTKCASAPSEAAHAATFAACPPAPTRVCALPSSLRLAGAVGLDDHVEQ